MFNKIMSALMLFSGLLLVVFVSWYSGGSKVLSSTEINLLLEKIQSQPQTPGGQHDIAALKQFLHEDDGQPFYTVNLYKYYAHAQYQYGTDIPLESQGSGREAFDRFSQVMIGLLVKHASHPIFGSEWMSENIAEWDRLVIVRYRSRRDIAQIFASDAFAQASVHKWAGLEKNQRYLVQGLHIPELYFIAMFMLFLIGIALYRRFRISGKSSR